MRKVLSALYRDDRSRVLARPHATALWRIPTQKVGQTPPDKCPSGGICLDTAEAAAL